MAALQPLAWTDGGLVCAPGAAPGHAAAALSRLPLAVRALPGAAPPLEPLSAMIGGLYRRGPAHAPAPPGIPEIVQCPGEGFGPGDHPTTQMCLEALCLLPAGPALDAGTGSGLLALAWARLGRGPVVAVDADARALAQARCSAAATGLGALVRLERRALESLTPAALTGRMILANVPVHAHAALLRVADRGGRPRAVLVSGLRPHEVAQVVGAWRRHGLRPSARARRGRWERIVLVRP